VLCSSRRSNQVAGRLQEAKNCSQRPTIGIVLVSSSATAGGIPGCAHFPPDILRNPPPVLEFRQCDCSCGRRNSIRALSLDAPSSRTGYPV
jgi:hypothetical protein